MNVAADTAIRVEGLGVDLLVDRRSGRSLREQFVQRVTRIARPRQMFPALEEVSFEVQRGELLGVLGPNGAGKTTLLRVLAGIIPPARGRVEVRGRVAPLIELGAGFDTELTGRENVFLYGSLLGLSMARLRGAFDAVVEFAGIGEAIDGPVRMYSSGMIARLAFAIATEGRPDVVLVDEVLAVGDEAFRRRCKERMDQLRDDGCAVVLVTHDVGLAMAEASAILALEGGRVRAVGTPNVLGPGLRQRSVA